MSERFPSSNPETPANAYVLETAGIEPAHRFPRDTLIREREKAPAPGLRRCPHCDGYGCSRCDEGWVRL